MINDDENMLNCKLISYINRKIYFIFKFKFNEK